MKSVCDQTLESEAITALIASHHIEGLNTGLWVFDIDNSRVLWANSKALEFWDADSLEELAARDMGAEMSVAVSERLRQYQDDFGRHQATFTELWTLYPGGKPLTLQVIFRGFRLEDGRMAMLCEALSDFRDTPETLRSAEALLHTSVMISLYSQDGSPLYQNPPARASQPGDALCIAERFVDKQDHDNLMRRLRRDGECRIAARLRTSSGIRWHEITARDCLDAYTGNRAFLFSEIDISDLKETEKRVRYLADHDVLTGLPNRQYLQAKVPELIEEAKASGKSLTLLLLDLDRFKEVNDTLGHAAGDDLLIEVANRLQTAIGDAGFVARLGGDEFLLCVNETDRFTDNRHIGECVLKSFEPEAMIANQTLTITPSIGISVFPKDGTDLSALMINADLALYDAKDDGKNCFRFFSVSLQAQMDDRIQLENDLHRALQDGEFELFYQPRINVANEQIVGAEALIRWHHPTKGLLNPDFFISACEETGAIDLIGQWVLQSAAIQQHKFAEAGFPITVSVNISPRQFRNRNLVPFIHSLESRTGCDPSKIELEITESLLMEDTGDIARHLQSFRDAGFGIALDDFGTGYSSLAYIQKYPFSSLKIDRSFIENVTEDGAIVNLIISMCKLLGLHSVAEGVEARHQLEWLQQKSCNEYQGFLSSPPVPIDEFLQKLEDPAKPDNVLLFRKAAG